MLGYAVETRSAGRKASPTTLALIVAGHAGLILGVMSSKMDLPTVIKGPPPEIYNVPLPTDPPPVPPEPRQPETPLPRELPIDRMRRRSRARFAVNRRLCPAAEPNPRHRASANSKARVPAGRSHWAEAGHRRKRASPALSRSQAPRGRGSRPSSSPGNRRARASPCGRAARSRRSPIPRQRAQASDPQLALHAGNRGRPSGGVVDRHHLSL